MGIFLKQNSNSGGGFHLGKFYSFQNRMIKAIKIFKCFWTTFVNTLMALSNVLTRLFIWKFTSLKTDKDGSSFSQFWWNQLKFTDDLANQMLIFKLTELGGNFISWTFTAYYLAVPLYWGSGGCLNTMAGNVAFFIHTIMPCSHRVYYSVCPCIGMHRCTMQTIPLMSVWTQRCRSPNADTKLKAVSVQSLCPSWHQWDCLHETPVHPHVGKRSPRSGVLCSKPRAARFWIKCESLFFCLE